LSIGTNLWAKTWNEANTPVVLEMQKIFNTKKVRRKGEKRDHCTKGLEYVNELEQKLIELFRDGSDSKDVGVGLHEMGHVRRHFGGFRWDVFNVKS
jgi:hypothetical protein